MATKAVFLDRATVGHDLDMSPLSSQVSDLDLFDATSDEQIAERIRDADFVIANKVKLTDELIRGAPQLRFIGVTATGTDNIDTEAAQRRGVAVCNVRNYCTDSVTEHVFGLLLALAHNLHRYTAAVRGGAWPEAESFCLLTYPIRELASMTLGIVGYGTLGKSVANRARQFGMDVIVSARPGSGEVPEDRVSFDELLERSDAISLHCPLTDDTTKLFGQSAFCAMKDDAVLVNTARGALVDAEALVAALASDEIGGAAIDVLENEPPVDGNPLLEYTGDNLIVTPHIAWASKRARQNAVDEMAANMAAFQNGEKRNRIV